MAADFSLLQTPNFAQAALSGYQAGAAIGKQKQLDAAMAGIDLSRPETLLPVLRADPSTGAALIGASVKIHAEDRAQQAQAALGSALGNYFSPGASDSSSGTAGGAAAPASPITASPTPANPLSPGSAPAPSDGSIVVNAPHPVTQMAPNLQQTVGTLLKAGVPLDQATQFVELAGKMTKTQADTLGDQQDAISSVATAIPKNLNLADRGAWVTAHKDFLLAHNVPEAKIDAFAANPTDDAISSVQTLALGTKDALTQAREAAAQAETVRQHGIENAQGEQRIGLEGANVGIARAHLGIDQAHLTLDQKKAAQTSGGGSAGGIATPSSAADYNKLASGTRYYKNGVIKVKP